MATYCYVLPGFLGSTLRATDPPYGVVWVSYSELAVGGVRKLALAANGEDPLPPHGVDLIDDGPLPDYYDGPLALLGKQLKGDGYRVEKWAWDWRKDLRESAADLARSIRENVTADNPCTIVGHSAGGLVARCVWANLKATNQSNLVRRVITAGTPNYGTYNLILALCSGGDTQEQIWWLNHVVGGGVLGGVPGYPVVFLSKDEVAAIISTWPAAYQLFPVVGSPDDIDDPFRFVLFNTSGWPTRLGLDVDRLEAARTEWRAFILGSASTPPAWVLTTIAGTGSPTPFRVAHPGQLGEPKAIGVIDGGDGTVSLTSALMPNSAQVTFDCRHMDLPAALINSGKLRELILDVRVDPDPPPPPEEIATPFPPLWGGPPIATVSGGTPTFGPCSRGKCPC